MLVCLLSDERATVGIYANAPVGLVLLISLVLEVIRERQVAMVIYRPCVVLTMQYGVTPMGEAAGRCPRARNLRAFFTWVRTCIHNQR